MLMDITNPSPDFVISATKGEVLLLPMLQKEEGRRKTRELE